MTSSACGAKGCSDHRFRAPPAYTSHLLALHQHRANNQYWTANQIYLTLRVSSSTQASLEKFPIQVLTELNVAWLQWSYENRYFQVNKPLRPIPNYICIHAILIGPCYLHYLDLHKKMVWLMYLVWRQICYWIIVQQAIILLWQKCAIYINLIGLIYKSQNQSQLRDEFCRGKIVNSGTNSERKSHFETLILVKFYFYFLTLHLN